MTFGPQKKKKKKRKKEKRKKKGKKRRRSLAGMLDEKGRVHSSASLNAEAGSMILLRPEVIGVPVSVLASLLL